jgi:hypothetical protein
MAKKAAKSTAKAAPKPAKITAASKQRKKTEIFTVIADNVGISRKQVAGVFDVLGRMMAADLAKPSADKNKVFVVPGMMKVAAIYKAATKSAQKPNPFKPGEMMTVKAKPARTVIKIRPLKGLKQMV